jgi:hypothetical protein
MQIIESFIVDKDIFLKVVIPDFNEKINYFYESTPEINRFDEVTVTLKEADRVIVLYKNTIDDAFFRLRNFLRKVLEEKTIIPDKSFIGLVGRYHNIDAYRHWKYDEGGETLSPDALEYLDFLLYSSDEAITWFYSDGSVIYIEVGYTFPLVYSSDALADDPQFEKFLHNYKSLFFTSLSFNTAREWLEKCNKIVAPFEF